jgi:hypothetical protein
MDGMHDRGLGAESVRINLGLVSMPSDASGALSSAKMIGVTRANNRNITNPDKLPKRTIS